jgi:uncharacterized protein (TIGR02118 family)
MFKAVWVARFREGMTREEGSAYWTDVHAPIGLRVAALRSYVQNHVVGTIGAAGLIDAAPAFDGYASEWSDDREAFETMLTTPEWAAVMEDGPKVFDPGSLDGMSSVVEQRVLLDGPRSPFKVAWFARFHPELTRSEASDYWLNVHGPIALEAGGFDRYVQNLVVGSISPEGVGDEPVRYDGFSECWFASEEAYVRAVSTEGWARLVEDGPNLLDMAALESGMSVVLEERVIKPEPEEGS